MVPPYRGPLFRAIAALPGVEKLCVLTCATREVNREWEVPRNDGYDQKVLVGMTINLSRETEELRFLHFRFGIFWELLIKRPDLLVIGDASWTSYLSVVACKLYRIRYVVWNEITTTSCISRGFPAMLRRFMYRNAIGFIASCAMARDYLLANGVSAAQISIVHNPVDNAFYHSQRARYANKRERLRQELGISEEAFCFIFVGQLISRKRVMETLELVAHAARLKPMHLLVVGSGPLDTAMRARAHELGFDSISFCGFVNPSRLSQLYVASDALILLSSDEPWGMVINEALLFGKGFVATHEVGAAVEMADGENTLCIPFEGLDDEVLIKYASTGLNQGGKIRSQPISPKEAAKEFFEALKKARG